MISTALFDEVVDAYAAGDAESLECLAWQGVPVQVVLFVASEGGGTVYDSAGLQERLAQHRRSDMEFYEQAVITALRYHGISKSVSELVNIVGDPAQLSDAECRAIVTGIARAQAEHMAAFEPYSRMLDELAARRRPREAA